MRKDAPGYEKLKWIFSDNVSLDEIVSRLVIPTLVTFDSKHAKRYPGDHAAYRRAVEIEIREFHKIFASLSSIPIEILLVYLPLGGKDELAIDFTKRLATFQ